MASTNFSRPRRRSEGHGAQRAVNTLSVVSERNEDLPSEARLSCDPDRLVSHKQCIDKHGRSIRAQPLSVRDQRYPSAVDHGSRKVTKTAAQIPESLTRDGYCNPTMPIPPDSPNPDMARRDSAFSAAPSASRPITNGQDSHSMSTTRPPASLRSDSAATTKRPPSSRSNSASTISSTRQPFVPKSILKVTTVEQTSERSASRSGSASGSNKSSENGSIEVSYDEDGKFVASEYDTSGLSEKEILKLQKKGINPALALEMKALRKGKSFGNLVGNAFV